MLVMSSVRFFILRGVAVSTDRVENPISVISEESFPVISESSSFLLTSLDLKEDCGGKVEK